MDDLATSLVALVNTSHRMEYDEAQDALSALLGHRVDAFRDENLRKMKWRDGNTICPDVNWEEWRSIDLLVGLRIAVEHEHWYDAARLCMERAGRPGIDRKSDWWSREVYYSHRGGLKGRLRLAIRSSVSAYAEVDHKGAKKIDHRIGEIPRRKADALRIYRNLRDRLAGSDE